MEFIGIFLVVFALIGMLYEICKGGFKSPPDYEEEVLPVYVVIPKWKKLPGHAVSVMRLKGSLFVLNVLIWFVIIV